VKLRSHGILHAGGVYHDHPRSKRLLHADTLRVSMPIPASQQASVGARAAMLAFKVHTMPVDIFAEFAGQPIWLWAAFLSFVGLVLWLDLRS